MAEQSKPHREDSAAANRRAASIEVRVRYCECDPMGVAHHSVFAVWFEMARTELLRQTGITYREIEAQGIYLVIARMNVRYRKPARYDDLLEVHVTTQPTGGVKIEHHYEVRRAGQPLASGETTLVCVDEAGRPRAVPDELTNGDGQF